MVREYLLLQKICTGKQNNKEDLERLSQKQKEFCFSSMIT